MPMFAPAQKNFSPEPVRTITCTSLSKRAVKMASSSWRIISCVYVFAGGSSSVMTAIGPCFSKRTRVFSAMVVATIYSLRRLGGDPVAALEDLGKRRFVLFVRERLVQMLFVLVAIEDAAIDRIALPGELADLAVEADVRHVQFLFARHDRVDLLDDLLALFVVAPARVIVEQLDVRGRRLLIFFRTALDAPQIGPHGARGVVVAEEIKRPGQPLVVKLLLDRDRHDARLGDALETRNARAEVERLFAQHRAHAP